MLSTEKPVLTFIIHAQKTRNDIIKITAGCEISHLNATYTNSECLCGKSNVSCDFCKTAVS